MEHVKALIIKFIMYTAVLWSIMGTFFGVDFGEVITISVILTPLAYVIGDLLILRNFNNTIATIADFGLSFIVIWLIGAAIINEPISVASAALISALALSVGEWFYHSYVNSQVFEDQNKDRQTLNESFTTEFAQETDVQDKTTYNQNVQNKAYHQDQNEPNNKK